MPDAWKCTNCRLVFPTGWFHYSLSARPYCAATLLACRCCGTAHAIEHAAKESEVKDRMFHLGEPFFDDEEPDASYNEERTVATLKWYKGPPQFSDWDGGSELETDKFADIACIHCGEKSLTDHWEESQPCPHCASQIESVASWIT